MRRRPGSTKYSRRDRDFDFMAFVKQGPCIAAGMSPCEGEIEADHAGRRGLGMKASDDTCIGLCTLHHRQRTDFSGPFRSWDQAQMRAWLEAAIAETRQRYASRGTADIF